MSLSIYLDHNATTPCDEEVIEAILPFFKIEYGNPASPHLMGKRAYIACNAAREQISTLFECSSSELIFTSGATESNNIVLLGISAGFPERTKIVTSSVEHKSVLGPCQELRRKGMKIIELPVSRDCLVTPDIAAEYIDEHTALVTVQAANNEVGVVQPIEKIAEIAHSKGALFHCDAVQMVGKLHLPQKLRFCDFLSISAHKMYGPKGTGALIVRNGNPHIKPSFHGGGHEKGLRPGTLNVPGIVGFGKTCEIIQRYLTDDIRRITFMRDKFEKAVTHALPFSWVNGAEAPRLPGTCSLSIPGIPATMLIANVPNLYIGEGSACATGAIEPSHVLIAMGLSRDDADCTVRVSFGRHNSIENAEEAAAILSKAALDIKNILS